MPKSNSKEKTLKKHLKSKTQSSGPLWKGPQSSDDNGGVTQSLLGLFLVDRERFRVRTIEGLQPVPKFKHRLEYGNLWHLCEEHYAAGTDWEGPLRDYKDELCDKYPLQRPEIIKWWNVCKVQFPAYVKYWQKNNSGPKPINLMQEYVFHVPYALPDSRVVWLKGKLDRVDHYRVNPVSFKKTRTVWLGEHKSKGEIDEIKIQQQLRFDLQTMFYLVGLQAFKDNGMTGLNPDIFDLMDHPLGGVIYNVVRRPLSGGEGSIRKHKPTKTRPKGETDEEFYNRLATNYIQRHPERWFMRWPVEVYKEDVEKFRNKFLNPILIQLCDWYDTITGDGDPFADMYGIHWQLPYGIFHPILEGKQTDLDEYLLTGSRVGLCRATTMFDELQP